MRWLGLALVALALLPATALAGRESAPEVEDDSDKPIGAGDLLAAWVDGHPEGLLVTFKVASIERNPQAVVYVLDLRIEGGARASPTVGFDQAGRLRTDSGENAQRWPNVDDALDVLAFERGEPAYLSAIVPWGLYDGLEPGADITVTGGHVSLCCENGRWITPYDEGDAVQSTFTVEAFSTARAAKGFFPILVPAWVIPVIIGTCTALGLAGGAGLAYATRPKAASAPPPASAPMRRVPPPGERFQRAPGKRQ